MEEPARRAFVRRMLGNELGRELVVEVGETQAQDPSIATTSRALLTRAMRGNMRRMSWSWLSCSGDVQASETMTRL